MVEVGLFFGSDEGNTEAAAYKIQRCFGEHVLNIHDIADVSQLDFVRYNNIILGIPTWDFGQIQSDWEEFWQDIAELDFHGKRVALYGLGDQFGYGDFFLDAMGMLHDVVVDRGAEIVGYWPTEGYDFDASKALTSAGDRFVGLALDEDQQPEKSLERISLWCAQVHTAFGLAGQVVALDGT